MAQDGEAYYRDRWKLIDRSSGEVELYDLEADPTEARDVAAAEPALVAELSAALAAFPRGQNVALPLWRIILDTDEFGGEETGPPMAERVRRTATGTFSGSRPAMAS